MKSTYRTSSQGPTVNICGGAYLVQFRSFKGLRGSLDEVGITRCQGDHCMLFRPVKGTGAAKATKLCAILFVDENFGLQRNVGHIASCLMSSTHRSDISVYDNLSFLT